jgi:predicted DNA-binding WGR domain protein
VVYLTKIDAARNMARFYSLDLQPDLFGGWALVRRWGRIGRGGQVRSALHEKREGAAAALERELRRGVVGIEAGEPGIFGIGEVIGRFRPLLPARAGVQVARRFAGNRLH